MDTTFWGPDAWKLLHSITTKYPSKPTINDKRLYYTFFNTIIYYFIAPFIFYK